MSIFARRNQLITIKAIIMIELKKVALSKLSKMEVRLLLENITNTLEKHDPQALRLQDIYEVLKNQETKVQILTDPHRGHILTPKLNSLHLKRKEYASLIYKQIESSEREECKETRRLANIAKRPAKEFLTYLGQKSLFDVDFQISLFFMTLRSAPEEQDAFVKLGLQKYLDVLKKTNDKYNTVSLERKKDINDRPPTGDRRLERETQKLMRLFFEQVNSFQKTFTDIDYYPLISALNVILTRTSKNLKTHIATLKRRARKKALAAKEAAKEINLTTPTEDKADDKTKITPMSGSSAPTKTKNTAKNKKKGKTKGTSTKRSDKPRKSL